MIEGYATSSEEQSSVRRWVSSPTLRIFVRCMGIVSTIAATAGVGPICRHAPTVEAELFVIIGIPANGSGATIDADIAMGRGATSSA